MYQFEAKLRATNEAVSGAQKEFDELKFTNETLHERNQQSMIEINSLANHCNVLQAQNRDLNSELESFVQ